MSRSFFEWVAVILERFGPLFLSGTANTVLIAVSGTVLGFGLGLLVAVARGIKPAPRARFLSRALLAVLKGVLNVYIEVFRGTPMMVQAAVIFYGVQMYYGIRLDALVAGVFVVSINTGAYMAEIVRGGIQSVDVGQTEAAHSIGMTHWQTMTSVVLPQAIRNIMPAIGNEFIVNIKDSCVLNVISVTELFFQARAAAGATYRFFEVYFIIGLIYLALTFTVSRLLRLLERRMDGPASYAIHGSQSPAAPVQKEGG